jgi:TP901 family phage tail tape measure protein
MAEIKESVILEVGTTGAVAESQKLTGALDRIADVLDKVEKRLVKTTRAKKETAEAEKKVGTEADKTSAAIDKQTRIIGRNEAGMRKTKQTLNETARAYSASAQAAQGALAPITRLAAILGAGLGARAAVTQLASLDRQMSTLGSITGQAAEQLARVRAEAIRIGESSPLSGGEVLGGAVQLAKAGFEIQQIIDSLDTVAGLATVEGIGLADSAGIVGAALKTFQLPASEAVRVTDALKVAANSANTTVQDLAVGLSYAGPIANAYGQEIESVAAALAAIADSGLDGSRAGTGLQGAILQLVGPSEEAKRAFSDLGLSIADLDPRRITLEQLAQKLREATEAGVDLSKVFESRSLPAALGLATLADTAERVGKNTRDSFDAVGAAVGTFQGDLQGALADVEAGFEAVITKTGDQGLTGALKSGARTLSDLVRELGGVANESRATSAEVATLASVVEGLGVTLGALIVFRGGAGLLAALTNPWVAAAAAIGTTIALYRDAGREVELLRQGNVRLGDDVEKTAKRIETFRKQFESINFAPAPTALTESDQLDRQIRTLNAARGAAAQFARELENAEVKPQAIDSVQKIQDELNGARREAEAARKELEELNRLRERGRPTEPGRLTVTASVETLVAQAEGRLREAENTVTNLESRVVEVGQRRLIPTVELEPLARAVGLLDELREAESKATDGFVDYLDAVRLAESVQEAAGEQAKSLKDRVLELGAATGTAAEEFRQIADASGILADLERTAQDFRDQGDAARVAAEGGRDYAAAIREVQDAQDIRIQTEQIVAQLSKDSATVTAEQRQQIEGAVRAYVEAARAVEDYTASLDAQARAADASQRAAERDAAQAEAAARRAQEQALQAAQAAAQRADQILTGLRLEIAAYSSTQEAVERLALEEDLRHLQVTDQTKERIRLALEEAQARRQLREVGAGIAGGFGDGVRTLAQTGDFGEAGAAALQGASERVFESSLARIEEAIAASFVDLTATPTIGETEIAVATRAVEAAVLQSAITISQAVAQGSALSSASKAASAGADAARTGTVGDPGVQGPPTAESQSRDSGTGVGGAILGAGIGLALGMVASRMGRDSEDDPRGGQVGFDVIGASGRGVVYDQRRVTQYLSPNPRSQPRTRRQLAEERINRR